MKTLWKLYYKLTMTDFESRIENAKKIKQILKESTKGDFSHFYDEGGNHIRGFYKRPARFSHILPTHPLVVKYK